MWGSEVAAGQTVMPPATAGDRLGQRQTEAFRMAQLRNGKASCRALATLVLHCGQFLKLRCFSLGVDWPSAPPSGVVHVFAAQNTTRRCFTNGA